MFRITEDLSSRSLVQCLAKNYKNDSIVSVDMEIKHEHSPGKLKNNLTFNCGRNCKQDILKARLTFVTHNSMFWYFRISVF